MPPNAFLPTPDPATTLSTETRRSAVAEAERSAAQIAAQAREGGGSRFCFTIPLRLAPPSAAAPAITENDPRALLPDRAPRILLVEDHPVNRRVVELLLEPLQVSLTMAENGAEAFDRKLADRNGRRGPQPAHGALHPHPCCGLFERRREEGEAAGGDSARRGERPGLGAGERQNGGEGGETVHGFDPI